MTIEAKFFIRRDDFTLDVDFSIPSRGVTAIFGPSGCGKTTLLRAMAGLDFHPKCTLKIGDKVWQEGKKFTPPHKRSLGYVFQEASLFPHLSARANLLYGLKRTNTKDRKVSMTRVIDLLGIESLLDRKPNQLSGGERQRVAIARALAVSPQMLLMDEPLAALDLKKKKDILPYLESLHTELDIPIVYVSHSPDEVARLADHLVLLENGKVTSSGSINDMLTRLDLSISHNNEAESLIQAKVKEHDTKYNLSILQAGSVLLYTSLKEIPIGNTIRVRIPARNVSISLKESHDTSILNSFPAKIDHIISDNKTYCTVKLIVDEMPFLARITHKSVDNLKLSEGMEVYADIKSITLLS
ncbi:MAG: molybdenum ABC transporter ATP-binding protein [Planctomycetes bacterium]|nr:molybdenum ABC transporter ATP-binding protein [Planctomycetota bacterium]